MAGKSGKTEAVKCNSFWMNNYKFVTFLHSTNNIHEFPINVITASRLFTCSWGVLNNVYGTGHHSYLYIAGMKVEKMNIICRVINGWFFIIVAKIWRGRHPLPSPAPKSGGYPCHPSLPAVYAPAFHWCQPAIAKVCYRKNMNRVHVGFRSGLELG